MLFPDKDQLTWALDLLCFESGCLHSSGLRRSSEQTTQRSVFLKAELENTPLEFADQSQVKYTSKNRFVTMLFPDKDQLTWALVCFALKVGWVSSQLLSAAIFRTDYTQVTFFLKAELENTPLKFADQSQVKYTSKNRFVTMLFPDKDQLTWASNLFCFERGVGVFTAPV